MKAILVSFLLCASLQAFAVEKTKITVKSAEKSNGVILVTINDGKKTVDLNCNDGLPNCAAPKSGEYWMVRLPKNRGMYDCQNVDLYKSEEEADDNKIGEFCLPE